MHLTTALTALLSGVTLATAAAQAQSIKPGLWEMSQKMGGSAQMDPAAAQMQQQMAGMSPAQRKQMEAMLAQRGMGMPAQGAGGGMAMKVCITPEMAAKQEVPMQGDGECTSTVTSRSAQALKMNFVCKKPPSSGEGTYTFSSDTAYTLKMVINTTHQGKPHTMAMDGQGQWLAADCGKVKPAK